MYKLKRSLHINRNVTERSEVDLNELPFLFCYQEGENNICIHADSFEGDINGFNFPFYADISQNMNNVNYDLALHEQHFKMLKSDKEITLSFQNKEGTKSLIFAILS